MKILSSFLLLLAATVGRAQSSHPSSGVLQGLVRFPAGTDLRLIKLVAPGYLAKATPICDLVTASESEPGWLALSVRGAASWAGDVALDYAPDDYFFNSNPSYRLWWTRRAAVGPGRDGKLPRIDLGNAFLVQTVRVRDESGRPIKNARVLETGLIPATTRNETPGWGPRGYTDANGCLDVVLFRKTNGLEVRAETWQPAKVQAPIPSAVTLRRGFLVRVHVPEELLPSPPCRLKARTSLADWDAPGNPVVSPYERAFFDSLGTAELYLPRRGTYTLTIDVALCSRGSCDLGDSLDASLDVPGSRLITVSEISSDIFVTPDLSEIAAKAAMLCEQADRWTWRPSSRPQ